jgi:hypothetical protein
MALDPSDDSDPPAQRPPDAQAPTPIDETRVQDDATPAATGDAAIDASPAPTRDAPADPDATEEWAPEHGHEATAGATPARDPELDALRDANFAVVWRGYDAHAVDAYAAAVARAVERFEERTYPTVAVQRALHRVGEQTAAILRQAEQSAEETTRSSRAQADDRLQRADREAAELQAGAIARVRNLDDDIERLWQERQRLIDATKELADQLRASALDAEARFPPAEGPAPPAPPFDAEPGADFDADADGLESSFGADPDAPGSSFDADPDAPGPIDEPGAADDDRPGPPAR